MSRRPHDDARCRRPLWPGLVLCAVFAAVAWSAILLGADGTSEAFDQHRYHEPLIRAFAAALPRVDLTDYDSATTPGYHLVLAAVARFIADDVVVLQLVSSLFGIALLFVVWRIAARRVDAVTAACLALPVGASSYVIGGTIWLTTDNAALLFVAIILGSAITTTFTIARGIAWSILSVVVVLIRQIHLWIATPIIVLGLAASPFVRRLAPRAARAFDAAPMGRRATAVVALAALLPFLVLADFASRWGGLTPPGFAVQHAGGLNPASITLTLALFGLYGAVLLPAFRRTWCLRLDRTAWLVMVAAAATGLLWPTAHDPDAGRLYGVVWEVVRRAPAPWDRSIVFPPLAAMGGFVLLTGWRAAARAGSRRGATLLLVSLAGWTAAQTANSQAWQRYCEPLVLIGLVWLVSLSFGDVTDGRRRTVTRASAIALAVAMIAVYHVAVPLLSP